MRTGGRPSIRLLRAVTLALAAVAFVVLLGASAPAAFQPATIHSLAEQGGGASSGGGTGGTPFSGLGPLLVIALAIAVVIVAAAAFILLRTRSSVAPPASAEGWWTCPKCGAGNLDGAARCHACSTWRTTPARPTPSAQP